MRKALTAWDSNASRILDGAITDGPWFPEYADNPLGFIHDILNVRSELIPGKPFMWEAQRYMVEALFKHRRIAVRGPRRIGKSFTIGNLIAAFFYTGPSRVLSMAPTQRQAFKVVWGEVIAAHERSNRLPLKPMATELRYDAQHYALPIPCKNPDALRGFHAGLEVTYGDPDQDDPLDGFTPEEIERVVRRAAKDGVRLLIVIDEPEAIAPEVFDILRGIWGAPNVYVAKIGNPMLGVDDDHEYVRAFHPDSDWHSIHISALPLAEYPDEVHADKRFEHVPEYLLPRSQIDEYLRDFDIDDPVLRSDLLGQFSAGSTLSLVITRTMLEAALVSEEPRRELGPRMGVDIGGGNPDPCVASLFMDGVKVSELEWRPEREDKESQVTIAAKVAQLAVSWGRALGESHPHRWDGSPLTGPMVSIDDSGLVGVCDILASRGFFVDRVNFGASARYAWREVTGSQRFKNLRAEMYWNARRLLQEGIARIPRQFKRSWQQACWAHFEREESADGPVIKLEPKDKIKERHGRSPDFADADVLALLPTGGEEHIKTAGPGVKAGGKRGTKRGRKPGRGWRVIG